MIEEVCYVQILFLSSLALCSLLSSDMKDYMHNQPQDGSVTQMKSGWTRKTIWVKELLGLPTYLFATIALMKISNGGNIFLVLVGIVPFAVTYNLLYEYIFPDLALNGQWTKGALLVLGQILFWSLIFQFLI